MGVDMLYVEFDPKPFSEKFYNELFNELKSVRKKLELGLHFGVWAGGLPSEKMIESISNIFPREMSIIELSPESMNEKIRKMNGRGYYSNDELIATLKKILKSKLSACMFYTVGLPFESRKEVWETIESARKMLDYGVMHSVFVIPIEPGSPMWLFPQRYKVKLFRKTFLIFSCILFPFQKGSILSIR